MIGIFTNLEKNPRFAYVRTLSGLGYLKYFQDFSSYKNVEIQDEKAKQQ